MIPACRNISSITARCCASTPATPTCITGSSLRPRSCTLDAELTEQLKALPAEPDDARAERGLALLTDYDHRIKALLTEIFGGENDFDKVLEGVNLAGTGANGKRVVQNLLDALTPILQDGAAQHLQTTAANARAEADAARTAREQA